MSFPPQDIVGGIFVPFELVPNRLEHRFYLAFSAFQSKKFLLILEHQSLIIVLQGGEKWVTNPQSGEKVVETVENHIEFPVRTTQVR